MDNQLRKALEALKESKKWQAEGEFGDPIGPKYWSPEYKAYMAQLDDAISAIEALAANPQAEPGNEPPAWKALQSLTNPYSDQARAHIWDMAIIEAMRTVLAVNPQAAQAQPVATAKLIAREPTPEMVAAAKQWAEKDFNWPAATFRAMWDTAPQATAPVQTDDRKLMKAAMHVLRSYEYGNAATEPAKDMADRLEEVIGKR
jgi:hypothetical protein